MKTSWEKISDWYDRAVGEKGHYFHQNVIFPQLLPLLKGAKRVLELGCGQGVLARNLGNDTEYVGVDLSPSLIEQAKERAEPKHLFVYGDATQNPKLPKSEFTDAVFLLSLQNIEEPLKALQFTAHHLVKGGKLFLVLNHPCFRIPRQASWQIDEKNKILFRRLDRYLSELKIPIKANPSKKDSIVTWSFHYSLSQITQWLAQAGFVVREMHEWCSDKKSFGSASKMENRAREEFPLFLTIVGEKIQK